MKVLVTGGAGYIGSHVVKKLEAAGFEAVIIDNLSTGSKHLISPQAHFYEGDIRDTSLLEQIFSQHQISAIIHFAALTDVSKSLQFPDQYYSNNFGGTLRLLEAAERYAVTHFVFSSTAAVYADPEGSQVTEQSRLAPQTPYGKSKLMSEGALQDSKMSYAILRYFNVSGASENLGPWGASHTTLVKVAAETAAGKRDKIKIFGTDYPTKDGTGVRDYIHVEDLADIHVLALQSLIKNKGQRILMNCGYGSGFSVREVLEAMKSVTGKNFKIEEAPRRPGDLSEVVANTDYLQKNFSWKPKHNNLKEICQSAYDWELKLSKFN